MSYASSMVRSAVALFIAVASLPKARGIDFTPTTGERTLEGMVFKQLVFRDEGRRVTYEQPRGWRYSGDATKFRLTPPDFAQAQAEIQQAPVPKDANFDAAATQDLQKQVLASLPEGNQNAAVVGEERSPITVNGVATYGVKVTYNLFGQDYEMSALFANLPKTQLQFRVIARKQDFAKVETLFRGSLISLQWQ
jgi:hypothetical protein